LNARAMNFKIVSELPEHPFYAYNNSVKLFENQDRLLKEFSTNYKLILSIR